jgi:hypothetical protein
MAEAIALKTSPSNDYCVGRFYLDYTWWFCNMTGTSLLNIRENIVSLLSEQVGLDLHAGSAQFEFQPS